MKIQIASDMHLEFPQDRDATIDMLGEGDTLILAGDIHLATHLDQSREIFDRFLQKHKNILFVPGNHEYYKTDRIEADNLMDALAKELEPRGFHLLRPGKVVEIEGQRFIGGTMWYPENRAVQMYSNMLSDFYVIKNYYPWCVQENKKFRDWMESDLKEGDVVVTHHLPSFQSVPPAYAGRAANCYYVSDMEMYIRHHKPKLWIHGHTHHACDYKIAETRIVGNPKGYPHENKPFNPRLFLEI